MKNKSLFNKFLFFINTLFAVVLLLSFLLPYISPKSFSLFAVISLFVPILYIGNFLFLVYWLLKLKKNLLLSLVVLAIGWFLSSPFYKFSDQKETSEKELKIMSFNVRMFNFYKWNKDEKLVEKTLRFLEETAPDILAIQEYYHSSKINFSYPYQYIKTKSRANKFGLAIFSKYPIIKYGSLVGLIFRDSKCTLYTLIVSLFFTISVKIILFPLFLKSKEPYFIIGYLENIASPNLLALLLVLIY